MKTSIAALAALVWLFTAAPVAFAGGVGNMGNDNKPAGNMHHKNKGGWELSGYTFGDYKGGYLSDAYADGIGDTVVTESLAFGEMVDDKTAAVNWKIGEQGGECAGGCNSLKYREKTTAVIGAASRSLSAGAGPTRATAGGDLKNTFRGSGGAGVNWIRQ
jgi:hypothetical protein